MPGQSPKEYLEICLLVHQDGTEILFSELFDLGFTGIDETGPMVKAYIESENFTKMVQQKLHDYILSLKGVELVNSNVLFEKNWNEEWEKGIRPQIIGSFYVYPSWNKENLPKYLIPLHIDPKMAFGTGTHETTRLLLEWLPEVITKGDRVLDAGTGTGILAIASSKLGAQEVFGFDIDPWSFENANENIGKNKVEQVRVVEGSLHHPEINGRFDVIIANINTIALSDMVPEFLNHLTTSGHVLLSGLLQSDLQDFKKHVLENRYQLMQERTMGEWAALWLQPIVS